MPKKRVQWKRGAPEIITSSDTAHIRDGDRQPSAMQFVEDSRGRHRAMVPTGEEQTHKLRDYELVDVQPKTDSRTGKLMRDARGKPVETLHYKRRK